MRGDTVITLITGLLFDIHQKKMVPEIWANNVDGLFKSMAPLGNIAAETLVTEGFGSYLLVNKLVLYRRIYVLFHQTCVLCHRTFVLNRRTCVLYLQTYVPYHRFFVIHHRTFVLYRRTYVIHHQIYVLYRRTYVLCRRSEVLRCQLLRDGGFVLFQTRVTCCRCSICNSYNTTHNTTLYHKVIPMTTWHHWTNILTRPGHNMA